ncbi:MAG: PAS domain S-box protein [Candidatus Bathyarchaeota archaeon]|nr:PAS domain S-box protein [Candidatus Bathyarchaeota archaeon]
MGYNIRVLHVDDEPDALAVTKSILEMEGNINVGSASSVDEALKKLKSKPYDVIISDYEMPYKSGLDFLAEIRKKADPPPFIVFTGKGREEVVVKALNLGAFRYINKHGDPETVYKELIASIKQAYEFITARREFLRSEEQFRQLFSRMPSGVAVYKAVENGKDFVFVDLNEAAERIEKIHKKDVIGRRVTEAFPGVRDLGLLQIFQEVWRTGKAAYHPCALYRDKRCAGSWRENWVYKLPNGNIVAIYNDITELKRMEILLKESEIRFRELTDSLPEVIFEVDLQGKLTYVNKRGFELTGYTKEDFEKGICVFDLVVPEEVERLKRDTISVMRGTGPNRGEFTIRKKDGTVFSVAIESIPIVSEGKVTGIRGIAIDLTESRVKEKESKRQMQEIRSIIDGIGDLLIVMDSSRRVILVNKKTCDFFKKKPEELLGKYCYEIFHGTDKPWPSCHATTTFSEKTTITGEIVDSILGITFLVTTSPILNEKGELIKCIHIAKDITEQKKNEAKIAALLECTSSILKTHEFAQVARSIFNSCKNLIGATAGYVALLSADGKENEVLFLDSGGYRCTVDPNLPMPIRGFREKAYQTQKVVYENNFAIGKWTQFLPRGHVNLDNVMFVPLIGDGKTVGLIGLANKQAGFTDEDASIAMAFGNYAVIALNNSRTWSILQNKEAQLRAITNSAIDGIIMIDDEGKIVFWNPAAEKIFGYTSNDVTGKNLHLLLSPAFYPVFEKSFVKFRESGVGEVIGKIVELEGLRKDGSKVPIELSLSALKLDNKFHVVGIIRDISERKRVEKELQEEHDKVKMINEKLRVVGNLTRHDVRNKLCTVTGNAYLIKNKHPDQKDIVDGLTRIEQAIKKIEDILDFSRMYEQLGVEKLSLIDVGQKIEEALTLFPQINKLKVINKCNGLRVLADSFLRQLFYNLIDNSIKHGGYVTKIRVYFERPNAETLNLIYEDNGKGITDVNRQKLFTEGFSTTGSSGYGLYLIKKMIEVYGWDIQEKGKEGEGAKIVITIPRINHKGQENFQLPSIH